MRIVPPLRRSTAVLTFALLLSAAANGLLAWLAREQHREALRARLDPASGATFVPRNAALGPAPAGVRRVVFFGDSRTEQWGEPPAPPGCQAVNRGRSNDTSGQLVLRVDRDVVALTPDLVVLEIGANDLRAIGALPGDEEAIRAGLRANVAAVVDRLGRAGVPVVLSTVFPFGEVSLARRPVWSGRVDAARAEWNREVRGMGRAGVTVFDADEVLAAGGRLRPEYRRDELHLNGAGYAALSPAVAAVIERCLAGR